MMNKFKVFLLLTFMALGLSSDATHLMGGSLTYTYLSTFSNGGTSYNKYKVTLKIYRDCTPRTDGQPLVEFDDQVTLGIYYNDPLKNLYQSVTSEQLQQNSITPPWDNSCPNKPKYCVMEGVYTWVISVPSYAKGYHLYWTRCCRNAQQNVAWEMGQGYYAFIPPTDIKNSSPYFTQLPVPFICIGDTIDYPNTTTDIDGDSLVYSFEWPYNGGDKNAPSPLPTSTLPSPLPKVQYNSGYSVSKPFGTKGIATINTATGLCKYFIPAVGNYSVAVEVKEYRKGVLIGVVRRDVQLIATDLCEKNFTPKLVSGAITTQEVIEGEELCFDIKFKDTSTQNVTLKGWGDPIDGTGRVYGKPAYASKINTTGSGGASSTFCWTPACGLASDQPYFITVEAKDNGCPFKSAIIDIFITVKPFIVKGEIKGNNPVCLNKITVYNATYKPSYQYEWSVENGVINSGQGTSTVRISWNSVGKGRIILKEKNALGCPSVPDTLDITILPPTPTKPISGDTIVCEYEKGVAYSIPNTAGSTYEWIVQNGNIVSGQGLNAISVDWGVHFDGKVSVIETSKYGCASDTMSLSVYISTPITGEFDGTPSVCPNVPGVAYSVPFTAGSTYLWFVVGGKQSAGGNTNAIRVDWGNAGNGMVKLVEINKYGCIGDTLYYPVLINWKLEGQQPDGDSIVCAFTSQVPYLVHKTNRSVYSWIVNGGTLTSGNGTNTIMVDWGAAGQGLVIVTEVSFDSVNMINCSSDPDTLPVRIAELPSARKIKGDFEFCESDHLHFYSVQGNLGSTYIWKVDTTVVGTTADTLSLAFPLAGNYTLSFTEITKDSCIGNTYDSLIVVHPVPKGGPIDGDSILCYPSFTGYTYTTSGLDESVFHWMTYNGTITTGQGSNSVTVDWKDYNPASVSVVEVSKYNCAGDTVRLPVFLDHPTIVLDYITVGIQNDQVIELYWQLNNAPRYNSKILVYKRAANTNQNFTFVDSVSAAETTYTDIRVRVNDSAYEYILKITDLCGNIWETKPHTSILLKGNKFEGDSAYDSWLLWTKYRGWLRGVLNYSIIRKMGDAAYETYEVKDDTTSYYTNGLESYTQCYRSKGYQRNGNYISYSNTVCINFDPIVWIPNAFSPNDDNVNDFFLLKGGALKSFNIKIYNRWGAQLFESDDLNNSWDGNFHDKPCQMDVYVYVVKYWGANNILETRTGQIHLLR
jgi:gliding motility-associated-like protein